MGFVFAIVIGSTSLAYDVDTHFYGTYSMARFAGIGHGVAAKLATSAQWMDESFISDPTSMIFLPVGGVKKRRLLHFPADRIGGQANAQVQQSMMDDYLSDFKKKLIVKFAEKYDIKHELRAVNIMTETDPGHEVASELLAQGLREGNLMKAGASLHVIEDSFAHAGTPAEQGHAMLWHWPDRPFSDVEKYFRMTERVFEAMVAVRGLLPPEALDCKTTGPLAGNCERLAPELNQIYSSTQIVRDTVSYNILYDKEYVEAAMRDFYDVATRAKYINLPLAEFNEILKAFTNSHQRFDSYQTLEKIIRILLKRQLPAKTGYMDICRIMKDMAMYNCETDKIDLATYISFQATGGKTPEEMWARGLHAFVKNIAKKSLRWRVPTPLGDEHRLELEDDKGPVRKAEMQIRNRNMQNLIQALYGDRVEFVPNATADERGFYFEVMYGRPEYTQSIEPKIVDRQPGVTYVTFNGREKNAFNNMIFAYLFPSFRAPDLVRIVSVVSKIRHFERNLIQYMQERAKISSSNSYWFTKAFRHSYHFATNLGLIADFEKAVKMSINEIGLIGEKYVFDLVNAHIEPHEENFFYRNGPSFVHYKEAGKVRPFLQPGDVWLIHDLRLQQKVTLEKR